MTIYEFLDLHYSPDGDSFLRNMLADGTDANAASEETGETPLHVATRRRRLSAVEILLDHGADIDAVNAEGKTAYAHAARRAFHEIATLFEARGANTALNPADRLAVAVVNGHLQTAKRLIREFPGAVKTGNPEEDRLLADVAGRNPTEPVELLIGAGADLAAGGLDGGTPLHQAAWFGQPENARLLIRAGAPLNIFDPVHSASPLHWAIHGSRYSGGCEERQDVYVELAELLLEAGSGLNYPGDNSDAYRKRLLEDASPAVRKILERHLQSP